MSDAILDSIHVYPVKGCAGIDLPAAQVTTTGLAIDGAADREWMVVDGNGRFITQRELPRLAQVRTEVTQRRLVLSAPHMASLVVERTSHAGARDVVVWRSVVRGKDAGEAAARWLSDWLAQDVRLVRFDRDVVRLCNPEYAGESGAHTYFADGYPVLVIGAGSLADLNERLVARGEPAVPMNRFRPNLVLSGLPAFDEDHIETFAIGDVLLRNVKPCTRCQVTTTDQRTAEVGAEPLRTLAAYRMDERVAGIAFGINAIVVRGGSLAAGMPVAVEYRF